MGRSICNRGTRVENLEMRIAVTGATGFVGRHVLSELTRHPVHVVAGTRNTSANNLDGADVEVVQLDINDSFGNAFALLGKPDVLIHLAWGGLPNYRSLHHFETELPMQYRFLRDLVQSGLSGLVVAGTCLEYGMQSGELFEVMDGHPRQSLRIRQGHASSPAGIPSPESTVRVDMVPAVLCPW